MKLAFESDPVTGQPVGLRVDKPEPQRPGPVTLTGRYGRVEPLEPRHAADLWEASRDDAALWTYMGYGQFADAERFTSWVAERTTLPDPYSYAVIDAAGRAVGIVTLMEIRPAMGVIEVGHIVYTPALQQTLLALGLGQASPPFGSSSDRVSILVLCGRDDPDPAGTLSFDQIYNQLAENRVNLRARRFLRDLRRDAVVDYR